MFVQNNKISAKKRGFSLKCWFGLTTITFDPQHWSDKFNDLWRTKNNIVTHTSLTNHKKCQHIKGSISNSDQEEDLMNHVNRWTASTYKTLEQHPTIVSTILSWFETSNTTPQSDSIYRCQLPAYQACLKIALKTTLYEEPKVKTFALCKKTELTPYSNTCCATMCWRSNRRHYLNTKSDPPNRHVERWR